MNAHKTLKHKIHHQHKKTLDHFHKKHKHVIEKAKNKAAAIGGAVVIAATTATSDPHAVAVQIHNTSKEYLKQETANLHNFLLMLNSLIAHKDKLNPEEEQLLKQALSKYLKMDLKVELDGNRMNEIMGYIGAEQHLLRWKGDNLAKHSIQKAGMAPLQGAFKDFENEEQEKWYIAAPIHELPNWNQDWATLKPWYRFRKVLVYNPKNHRAVAAVIGDAGPAKWTGKTFGGSPEVMNYLKMVDGSQKGKVIVLFVNDPDNKIPLGPVESKLALPDPEII